ncbi:syntaxin-7-like [Littorina saxatilis]|uniref:t-SNARE coiled-coil homology domain-containing protein n=1 Tax=Littorina saxatilis TaxID=31220 RepID=A0AAN9B4B3_9CAEN
MSGYGSVREYRDDPFAPQSRGGYQTAGPASLDDLCNQIRSNIFQINNGANTIDRALKAIGTERDTPLVRDKIHETSQNTNKTVKATTKLLRDANALRSDRTQKMQIGRLTSDFQDAISRFQSLQKKATEKAKTAVKLGSQNQQAKPLVAIAGYEDTDDRRHLVDDDRAAQLQAQEVVIEDDLSLLREREERIRQLESDVLDVNEIFRDLGAMISEQGEVLNDIEANVERAYSNVEGGNEQLVKAAEYQRKSRKKMCCLLVIFLVVAVVITVIIVVAVKS